MFLSILDDVLPKRADWMVCALVLGIALWGAALDVLSMDAPQVAGPEGQLRQIALTANGK